MFDVRKRLQEELNSIEHELRVELPREILRAREHGDLSENAEYKAAKERQRFLEGRKAQLQQRMAALSLVNLDKIPTDRVAYGSKVILYDHESDKEIEYRLVSPEESDMNRGLVSITSPIGKSLVGKEEGDEVDLKAHEERRRSLNAMSGRCCGCDARANLSAVVQMVHGRRGFGFASGTDLRECERTAGNLKRRWTCSDEGASFF